MNAINAKWPAKQGCQSYTCGLFVCANAVHLFYPKIPQDVIFNQIFDYYLLEFGDAYGLLTGIYRFRVNKILKNLVTTLNLNIKVQTPYWSRQATDINSYVQKLRSFQDKYQSVFIVGYDFEKEENPLYYSHWTIFREVNSRSFITYDSDNEARRIQIARTRHWDEDYSKKRPYRISSTDTFILTMPIKEK